MNEFPVFMESIGQWVIQPNVIFGYVGFLVLLFIINVLLFLRRYWTVRRGVNQGVASVAKLRTEEGFSEQFDDVDRRISGNGILQETWSEFKESLIFPTELGKPIQNSRDTEEYFHSSAIIDRHLSVRYYNSVPNILTGLGILGTFIGLAAGIGVAQASLGADDLSEVQDALGGLLGGASLAFITSIAGLFLSIMFLGIERTSLGHLQRELRTFVRRLDSLLARVTPERLLTDQLLELKEQSRQLKAFNDDLAFSIAFALDERITERLTPALDRLIGAVHELRDRQSASNEQTIRALVDEFRATMSGATGAEFEKISQTLLKIDGAMTRSAEQLAERESSLQRSVQELVAKLGHSLTDSTERMRADVSQGVREMLEAVQTSASHLRDTIGAAQGEATSRMALAGEKLTDQVSRSSEHLGNEIRSLQGHVQSVQHLVTSVEQAASQLTDASAGTERVVRRLTELEESLRTTAQEIGNGSRLTAEATAAVQASVSRVHGAVEDLGETQRKTAESWNEYRSRFEGLDQSLREVFHELDSGLKQYTERVNQFHNGMDKNLSSAVETLGGAVRGLEEVLEDVLEGGTPR